MVLTTGTVAGMIDRMELKGEITVFDNVQPEPDTDNLADAVAAARDANPESGGRLWRRLGDGCGKAGHCAARRRCAGRCGRRRTGLRAGCNALALVPTTAGTGSEAGIRALVTDSATLNKVAVESPWLMADMVALDPDLTMTVPPAVTAATGIDAMAHCVEAFTNNKAHPLIDNYARTGFDLVARYLPRAVQDGSDAEARAGLLLAAYYGGICLGPVNTAAGHALAYPLGTRLKLPHGLANAVIFPHVLAFNHPVAAAKTGEIASALGLRADSLEALLEDASQWCGLLGVEMRLSKLGANESQLEDWAREAHAIRRLMDNNPRDMSVDDVLAIYRAAF